jgi:hypothetical protein
VRDMKCLSIQCRMAGIIRARRFISPALQVRTKGNARWLYAPWFSKSTGLFGDLDFGFTLISTEIDFSHRPLSTRCTHDVCPYGLLKPVCFLFFLPPLLSLLFTLVLASSLVEWSSVAGL